MIGRFFYEKDDGTHQGGGDPNSAPKELRLEVDGEEKVFTPEMILDMHKNLGSATQNSQKAAPLLRLAEQTGMDPEDLAGQVGNAFALLTELQDKGLLDQDGNIVQPERTVNKPDDDDNSGGDKSFGADKIVEIVRATLKEELTPFQRSLQGLQQDSVAIQRHMISSRLREAYPDAQLSDQDVAQIMVTAKQGKKTVKEVADEYISRKKGYEESIRKQVLEEWKKKGFDPDSFNENDLDDQDGETVAGRIVGNKKLSFRKGKDTLTPAEATRRFLDMRLK